MSDHDLHTARVLHGIDPATLSVRDRIRLATALATLANARETRMANYLTMLEHADELGPHARRILIAVIRRRARILPPPTGAGDHGHDANGGT